MLISKDRLAQKLKDEYYREHKNAPEEEVNTYAGTIIDALSELNVFVRHTPSDEQGDLPEAEQDFLGQKAEAKIRLLPYGDPKLRSNVWEDLTKEQWGILQTAVRILVKM